MPLRDAECLSMDAAGRRGLYRMAYNGSVFYVQIHPSTNLDDDDFAFVPAIRKILTPPPAGANWAAIRNGNQVDWTHKVLRGVSNCWHPKNINIRELQPIRYFSPRTCKVLYDGQPAFAKIARFEYEIPWIERETLIYRIIENQLIGPRFLGHLSEEGRVIGVLLEYLSDTHWGTLEDLGVCLDVLRRLHKVNVLHKDVNRYNFMLRDGCCWMCDFEDSEIDVSDKRLEKEEESLTTTLHDNFREDEDDWSSYGQQRLAQARPGEYRL